MRSLFGIELRRYGYKELLRHKYVRSKPYLTEVLAKCGIIIDGNPNLEMLQEQVIEQVAPSVVLGGISPRDGLPIETLNKWCAELSLNVSGVKSDLIKRILCFYDDLLQKEEIMEDPRELWYTYFNELASRNADFLRRQQIIEKDIEMERKFEDSTRFLFEKKLQHKPLTLVGVNHADGAVSFKDSILYWDNKSKESPVNLKDHIKQFDGYVKSSEKRVGGFLVIGPEFTEDSNLVAMQYQVENGTTMTLITAQEIKSLAEDWVTRQSGKESIDPFPLGYLIQPARFNRGLVPAF